MQRIYSGILLGLFCAAPLHAVLVEMDHMVHPNGSSVILAGDFHEPHRRAQKQQKALLFNCFKLCLSQQLQSMFIEDENGAIAKDKRYRVAQKLHFGWLDKLTKREQVIAFLKQATDRVGLPYVNIDIRKMYHISTAWPKLEHSPTFLERLWGIPTPYPDQADVPSVYELSYDLDTHIQRLASRAAQYEQPLLINRVQSVKQWSGEALRTIINQFPEQAQLCQQLSLGEWNALQANKSQPDATYAELIRQINTTADPVFEWEDRILQFIMEPWGTYFKSYPSGIAGWLKNLYCILFDLSMSLQVLSAVQPSKVVVAVAGLWHTNFLKHLLLQSGYKVASTTRGHIPGIEHQKNPKELLDVDAAFEKFLAHHPAQHSKL